MRNDFHPGLATLMRGLRPAWRTCLSQRAPGQSARTQSSCLKSRPLRSRGLRLLCLTSHATITEVEVPPERGGPSARRRSCHPYRSLYGAFDGVVGPELIETFDQPHQHGRPAGVNWRPGGGRTRSGAGGPCAKSPSPSSALTGNKASIIWTMLYPTVGASAYLACLAPTIAIALPVRSLRGRGRSLERS
jgi:hypothetical protein